MLDADHLRIVFRVNGVGFVMPVAQLLAIRGPDEYTLSESDDPASGALLGTVDYRDSEVAIYDLGLLLGQADRNPVREKQLLIFSGSDFPWAICVDNVSGVVDSADIEFKALPAYVLCDSALQYQEVAEYDDHLLVSIDAGQLDQAWGRLQ